MAIMYICDKKKYCNTSILCGTECKHTADRNHALFKRHEHFIKIGDNSWEKEPEKESSNGRTVE